MKHRILITALAAITLTSGTGIATTMNTMPIVKASPFSKRKEVNKGYCVECLTDKRIKVAKIHWRIPHYKSWVTRGYYVPKHSIVYIRRLGTDFGWYLKTSRHAKTTYTVLKKFNDYSWFELW